MRHVLRRWLCMTVCAVAVLVVAAAPAAWADDLNRDLLKKGMSLNDVIRTFGQPTQIEWVNVSGTAVLFVFYPTDKSDAVFRKDGLMLLPLGFVTEALAGWGKDFYEQNRSAQAPPGPSAR
ncbi:MAG: hypothetical protein EPO02_10555 [Nitrospirae bacterium]|nr:MAG: hypothetical protein EPO02_10555 [Nitrospirota bacterium]